MSSHGTDDGLRVAATAWSRRGRFLIYEVLTDDETPARLGFYDTASDAVVMVPLTEIVDEIRTQSNSQQEAQWSLTAWLRSGRG